MTKAELYQKACMLPLLPGVYIIRDKTDTIIYIGKAKALKNRRYQQRQQGGHCQIYHQYLQRKYQTGNRRLENACNRTGSTTSHQ